MCKTNWRSHRSFNCDQLHILYSAEWYTKGVWRKVRKSRGLLHIYFQVKNDCRRWNLKHGSGCLCRWGHTMSLNCDHQQAYCSYRMWYMSVDSHGRVILTGKIEELGEESVPVPLCPLQLPHELTRMRARTSAVRGRRLNNWAMARSTLNLALLSETSLLLKLFSVTESMSITVQ
jgi:hypothetical protein